MECWFKSYKPLSWRLVESVEVIGVASILRHVQWKTLRVMLYAVKVFLSSSLWPTASVGQMVTRPMFRGTFQNFQFQNIQSGFSTESRRTIQKLDLFTNCIIIIYAIILSPICVTALAASQDVVVNCVFFNNKTCTRYPRCSTETHGLPHVLHRHYDIFYFLCQ